ncbi:MAG: nuclear transport factor 2 family protein [Candidatus Dormibacteria bacterium]
MSAFHDGPEEILDALLAAIAARDLGGTVACFSADGEVSVLGSESGEAAVGIQDVTAFVGRLYSKPEGYRFDFPHRRLRLYEDVAWLAAEGEVTEPGEARPTPYRLITVFLRLDSGWRVVLWSGSEPRAS